MQIHVIAKRILTLETPAPSDATATLNSVSGNDDGGCAYNTDFYNNQTVVNVGHDRPCGYFCFYPAIPKNSTINECIFTATSESAGWSLCPDFYLRFINEDNPDQPIAGDSASKTQFQNYSKTSYVLWPALSTPNVNGILRTSPDLKDILQTVVNRTGWSSGNRLILYIGGPAANIYANEFNGPNGIEFRSYDYGAPRPALSINWTPPA